MIKNATSSGFYTRTEPYNLNINSPSTCHEKCESNKGCHYYAYSAENKKCILMNSKATKNIVYEPGTDFWQKDCVLGKMIRNSIIVIIVWYFILFQ